MTTTYANMTLDTVWDLFGEETPMFEPRETAEEVEADLEAAGYRRAVDEICSDAWVTADGKVARVGPHFGRQKVRQHIAGGKVLNAPAVVKPHDVWEYPVIGYYAEEIFGATDANGLGRAIRKAFPEIA